MVFALDEYELAISIHVSPSILNPSLPTPSLLAVCCFNKMVVSSIKTSAVAIGFKDIPHQEAFQKWATGAGNACLSLAL